ncbi:recombination repair protein 1 isoform X2 [Drosophila bipectinata]|uniref:recombination repair protein 1 isoform X2 n=1 Tax=Drosophila bipectinata TaxID=42026 RepID=UPI0038B264AC
MRRAKTSNKKAETVSEATDPTPNGNGLVAAEETEKAASAPIKGAAKGKARPKKNAKEEPEQNSLEDPQPVENKKAPAASRGKKKQPSQDRDDISEPKVVSKPKGRAKKPSDEPEAAETEQPAVKAAPAKGRKRKEPSADAGTSAEPPKRRAKKDTAPLNEDVPVPSSPPEEKPKKGERVSKPVRGTKRLAESEIASALMEEDEPNVEPPKTAPKRSRKQKPETDLPEDPKAAVKEEPVTEPPKTAPKRVRKQKQEATPPEDPNSIEEAPPSEGVKKRTVKKVKENDADAGTETGRKGQKKNTKPAEDPDLIQEPPPKAAAKKKTTKKTKEKDAEDETESKDEKKPTKARGKKQATEEEKPVTTKKRGQKAAPTKDDAEDEIPNENAEPVRGRKKAVAKKQIDDEEVDGSKTSKASKNGGTGAVTELDKSAFTLPSDKTFNLKISSWNVAGLRAWLKKDGLKLLDLEEPDIFCLQETKCSNDQLPEEVTRLPGYHPYWLCMPGGYAGVAIYSKIMPINVEYGIKNEEFDDVGRMITAEYEKFYLINVYVPNSGRKLVNLEARMRWEKLFQTHVQKLDALKPVVICGDMNVSHMPIDLANPKTNTRNAGFTQEERDKMTELLGLGFVDTFRHLYPDRKNAYTFWTYMANARARNVGWRLDYCLVSERFLSKVVEHEIRKQCLGSDHCPITIFFNI